MYRIGKTTGKHNFTLKNFQTGEVPIDLTIEDMLGTTPGTVMTDNTVTHSYKGVPSPGDFTAEELLSSIEKVLQLESVACKDWLVNKVDRSVTGLIACQQSTGEIPVSYTHLDVYKRQL